MPPKPRVPATPPHPGARRIQDNPADLRFADPPYGQEFLPHWGDLGEFAERVLKPGALLVTYAGQAYLGPRIVSLSRHLDYVWCMAVAHDYRTRRIHHKRMINAWKPLLVFGKGTCQSPDTIRDRFQGTGASQGTTSSGAGIDEAVHFIRALVPANSLVVDPCMGSATTGVAALRCGMRFEGCEVDPETYRRARSRSAREAG